MTTVKGIEKLLRMNFNNHLYELVNSYVFDWECDWFSMTKTGYAYEVEIKVSRSDFLADFKKEKHEVFKNAFADKPGFFQNLGKKRGDYLFSYEYGYLKPPYNEHGKNSGIVQDWPNGYLSNQWQLYIIRRSTEGVYAPATRIKWIDLAKYNLPNRFFYACPDGLLKENDIPPYAGLIYCNEDKLRFEIIKQAPFIHKRKMDLSKILLDKFYYLKSKKYTGASL